MSMRIGGLASGIDTDALVKQLMDARRIPVTKLTQQRQMVEWQRDAYREMNSALYDFRNNQLFNFKLEGNLMSKKATIAGDNAAVSVKVSGSAVNTTTNIEVMRLATAATKWSQGDIRSTAGNLSFRADQPLKGQDSFLSGDVSGAEYTFKINGTEITVDPEKDSLNSVIARINKETNVSAFFDASSGQISFASKQTGLVNGPNKDGAHITFEDVTGAFLSDVLKINTAGNTADDSKSAQNAEVKVNGMTLTPKANSLTINGMEVSLLKEGAASVTVQTDADDLVDKIKGFIDEYNKMLKMLQDKTKEQRYRDYTPLTAEQKEQMSEKEIERWEERASSGLLRNDQHLNAAVNNMRRAATGFVDTGNDKYRTLSSLGIVTGDYSENGKLYLNDETKLRQAIEEDLDAVIALFTANGTESGDGKDVGILERMYEDLGKTISSIGSRAGTSSDLFDDSILGKQLSSIAKEIDVWNRRLADMENRYYRQFTAMERALNNMNSQSAYLANAFGGN